MKLLNNLRRNEWHAEGYSGGLHMLLGKAMLKGCKSEVGVIAVCSCYFLLEV